MDGPDVPPAIVERVRAICAALPETTERVDKTAHAFEIRRKIVAYLIGPKDGDGNAIPVLAIRADPDELHALTAGGHPYFRSNSGPDRLGIVLGDDTDWDEVAELITESYRLLAPKRLVDLLDEGSGSTP